jgi:heat shock 70kDa protein 1/2/6/8
VSAADKATGKHEKITITNEKGRLSKDDIEKMVQEAERFKDEDNKIKARIEAKNGLENYIFQMKNTLNDEKLKDKFTDADKKVIEDAAKEGLQFVESAGESATADEFNKKLKDIEGKFNPIMMRVYQAAGGAPGAGGMPGGMPGGMGGATAGAGAQNVDDLD